MCSSTEITAVISYAREISPEENCLISKQSITEYNNLLANLKYMLEVSEVTTRAVLLHFKKNCNETLDNYIDEVHNNIAHDSSTRARMLAATTMINVLTGILSAYEGRNVK